MGCAHPFQRGAEFPGGARAPIDSARCAPPGTLQDRASRAIAARGGLGGQDLDLPPALRTLLETALHVAIDLRNLGIGQVHELDAQELAPDLRAMDDPAARAERLAVGEP